MAPSGNRAFLLSGLVVAGLLLLIGALPPGPAERVWASDTLQLLLSVLATASLVRAVLGSTGVARAFWLLLSAATLTWAVGQVMWTLSGATFADRSILAPWDFFFLGCALPLLIALMLRPDRRRTWSLGLAFDLVILALLVIHAFVYVGLGYAFFRDVDAYVSFAGLVVTVRGALLPALSIWLLRAALPPWQRTYRQLAAAVILWSAGDAISSSFLRGGSYLPGLLDLPWTLPFVWIALLAHEGPRTAVAEANALAPDWRATRRGTALVVLGTAGVPLAHLLRILLGSDPPALVRRRSALTFLTLLVVVALLLARQLQLLQRIEAAARDELETRVRLQRTERMSAVGMLVAGVAHELNNPLTAILGHAELLKRRPLEPADPGKIEQIRDAAERCARIVKSLLLFTRDTGAERSVLDLGDLVRRMAELEANELRVRGVRLLPEIDPGVSVVGNSGQLQQVVVNLVTNALLAIADKPGASRLRLRVGGFGNRAVLEVEDDGPGLPEALRERVFEPLYTTRRAGEGTGLGLAICRDIALGHGGSLTAHSGAWGGALLRMVLPLADAPAVPDRVTVPQAPDLTGVRVLVVDDEPSLRELIARILQDAGADVRAAADGETALRMIEPSLHAVVSDVRMPGMGGAAFYERCLAANSVLRGRFVFVTGDTASRETWEFLAETGCETLQKPFPTGTLVDAVARVVRA